jgi:hypothetical protein
MFLKMKAKHSQTSNQPKYKYLVIDSKSFVRERLGSFFKCRTSVFLPKASLDIEKAFSTHEV